MKFIFNSLPWFDQSQLTVSEWLTKLEQRFHLVEITNDAKKIKLCQVYIGLTGKDTLEQLPAEITWVNAKRELITCLVDGLTEEEVHDSLKQLSKGDKDVTDLGG